MSESAQMWVPPTVCIGIPSVDYVHTDFALCLAHMIGGFRAGNIILTNAKGCYVDNGRNECVRIAQEKGATHLMFLDSDMMFPGNTLERLMSHKKEIVGCIYSRRVAPFTNLGTPKDKAMSKVGGDTVLLEMDMVPTGVLLIDMKVFERIDKPYFQRPMRDMPTGPEPMGEDVHFCERMRVAGYKLWADVPLSAQIGHIGTAVYKVHDESKARAALVGQGQDRMIGEKTLEAAE